MGTFVIIVILAVVVVFALRGSIKHTRGEGGCCGGGGSVTEETVKLENPVVMTKVVRIDGMHCDNCKNAVTRKLQRMDGVSCKVNLKKKAATIQADHEVSDAELKQAVEQAGYTVISIETK